MGSSGAELDRLAADLDRRLSGSPRLPFVGDQRTREGVNLLTSYAGLIAVALARAEFYGVLLDEQYEAAQAEQRRRAETRTGGDSPPGYDEAGVTDGPGYARGLIGFTGTALVLGNGQDAVGEFVATGEETRALVALESQERDRAATLIEKAIKMGIKLDQVEVMRSYAGTISAALKTMAAEIGLPMSDDAVLRAAKRAGLAARRAMGHDEGSPDAHIGPRMTPQERVRALQAALTRAEREAAAEAQAVAVRDAKQP